jgi:uncharacterized phage protein (TIGR02220 family)
VKIQPKNWEEFQHYRDRNPQWIKLHRKLLDDYQFHGLPVASRALAPMLWLIASESLTGVIDADCGNLAFRLRMDVGETEQALQPLLDAGFFVPAEHEGKIAPATNDALREANGFGNRYIPDALRKAVFARDGGKCRLCQAEENIEIDHIHPVSRGGNSEIENLQLLCRPCNRRKRTRLGYAEQVATQNPDLRSLEKSRDRDRDREETPLVPLKRDVVRLAAIAVRQKQAREILDFLNAKAGKHFKPVPANLKFLEARLAEGVTVQDLKTLTVRKCREWLGTDMAKFLRPETLFNATKCASYLGEIPPEDPCSVPTATAESPQTPPPAPAAGSSPNDSPPPDPSRIRTMAGALGRALTAGGASTLEH